MTGKRLSDEEQSRILASIAADPDNPELTDDQLANIKRFEDVFPALSEGIRRSRGRPRVKAPKEAVTLRLSAETIARYKAIGGNDWRARMTEALDKQLAETIKRNP
jgi:uncharacterized protein (DUF4415 family)